MLRIIHLASACWSILVKPTRNTVCKHFQVDLEPNILRFSFGSFWPLQRLAIWPVKTQQMDNVMTIRLSLLYSFLSKLGWILTHEYAGMIYFVRLNFHDNRFGFIVILFCTRKGWVVSCPCNLETSLPNYLTSCTCYYNTSLVNNISYYTDTMACCVYVSKPEQYQIKAG